MGDLFDEAAGRRLDEVAPLAIRLRPQTLDEFVGQEHVVGPGRALRLAIEADRVPSLSSTARPARARRRSRGSSPARPAPSSRSSPPSRPGRRRARGAGACPRAAGREGRRTILFLDEIHRFNKAQQDALLPAVEEGLVTLIGATTENPYFELNSALLSRTQLYELEPLERGAAPGGRARAAQAALGAELFDDVPDARRPPRGRRCPQRPRDPRARGPDRRGRGRRVSEAHVEDAARKRPLVYDKARRRALRLHLRLDQVDARERRPGVRLLPRGDARSGEDARFIARRMIVLASEDIGNADPQALLVAVAAAQAVEHVGLPEARLNLAQAAVYLARAPKSNASYTALGAATAAVREHGHLHPPDALRSAAYPGARKLGRGRATATRTTIRRDSRSTACPTSSRAASSTGPPVTARRRSGPAGGLSAGRNARTGRDREGRTSETGGHGARQGVRTSSRTGRTRARSHVGHTGREAC